MSVVSGSILGCDGFCIDSARIVIGDPTIGCHALYNDLRTCLNVSTLRPFSLVSGEIPQADARYGHHGGMLLHNMRSWVSLVAQEGWENYQQPPFLGDSATSTFTDEYQEHYDKLDNPSHICF